MSGDAALPGPLRRSTLRGIWAALLTPWTADDELDEARFVEEIRAYGGTGIQGVYTGGTTGEFYAQDDATFVRITELACREGRAIGLPVQVGCTALSTRIVCARVRVALEAGAEGIQIALPFWLGLNDDEVVPFFREVADAADGTPLILYHTDRAKKLLSPESIALVAGEVPTLIGMKYPAVEEETLREILRRVPDLAVFVGEPSLLRLAEAGACGCYSSICGLNARATARLYELVAAERLDEARPLSEALERLATEVLHPMVQGEGLWDSAVDRVMRVAGGVNVGLNCQRPYRSATPEHVQRVLRWCAEHAPELLPNGHGR